MNDLTLKIMADWLVIPIILIGAYTLVRFVPNRDKVHVYSHVLMAGLTAYVLAKIAGLLYQPSVARPFELLGVHAGASYLNNPGFPSDHALFTMAVALAVLFAARRPWWGIICLILAALVCVGRVLALVHTPLDVVGGIIIAAIGALWYIPLMRAPRHPPR